MKRIALAARGYIHLALAMESRATNLQQTDRNKNSGSEYQYRPLHHFHLILYYHIDVVTKQTIDQIESFLSANYSAFMVKSRQWCIALAVKA